MLHSHRPLRSGVEATRTAHYERSAHAPGQGRCSPGDQLTHARSVVAWAQAQGYPSGFTPAGHHGRLIAQARPIHQPARFSRMAGDVRVERVKERVLAAVRDTVPKALIGDVIRRGLGAVWPLIREQGVRFGHNVFVYRDVGGGLLEVEAGVEIFGPFEERGEVRRTTTPAGEAITTAHFGDYAAMRPAYEKLERWCADNGRKPSGTNWEVYGDSDKDPAKVRTDIYFLLSPR